jgi:hypothetical protein
MFNRKPNPTPAEAELEAAAFLAVRAAVAPSTFTAATIAEIATIADTAGVETTIADLEAAVVEELERRRQAAEGAQAEQEQFLAILRARDEQRERDEEAHREWALRQRPQFWVDVKVPDPDAGRD